MPLVRMTQILRRAQRDGYGVGAFNLLSMEAVKGALRAAETLRAPIIIELAEVQLVGSPMRLMLPMMLEAARLADVPVAVHYDHGLTFDNILRALKYGCTSVMIDASSLPFEQNVDKTKQAVAMAHAVGADCEAEIGVVGVAAAIAHPEADDLLTDPAQAACFVAETGCDALAVAIGNAHGPYVTTPHLRLDRLQEIAEVVHIPLVLHGGSGITDDDFRACVAHGVRKINVATALQQNVVSRVLQLCQEGNTDYFELAKQLEEGVFDEVSRHICVFGSDGKAGLD